MILLHPQRSVSSEIISVAPSPLRALSSSFPRHRRRNSNLMASSNPTASSSSSSYASTSTTSTSASSSNPTFNPNVKSKSKSSDASQYQSQSHSISPPPGPHPTVKVRRVPWATHALRQLKLVLPGALITYYLGTFHDFWSILQGTSGGALARCVGSMFYAVISRINLSFVRCDRFSGWAASGLALLTIGLFLYMLFLPWITGEEPNVRNTSVLCLVWCD